MQIDNIFPNPIMTIQLPKEVTQKSLDIALDYADTNNWSEKNHYGNSITTFHDDIQRNYCGYFDPGIAEFVVENSRQYLELIGFNPHSNLRCESWLNLNKPNTQHGLHEHYGSLLSSTVWLQTDEDCGNFTFKEPIGGKSACIAQYEFARTNPNQYVNEIYKITPKSGEGVIFQSWMSHYVGSNKSQNDRYSIAFNIWVEK